MQSVTTALVTLTDEGCCCGLNGNGEKVVHPRLHSYEAILDTPGAHSPPQAENLKTAIATALNFTYVSAGFFTSILLAVLLTPHSGSSRTFARDFICGMPTAVCSVVRVFLPVDGTPFTCQGGPRIQTFCGGALTYKPDRTI